MTALTFLMNRNALATNRKQLYGQSMIYMKNLFVTGMLERYLSERTEHSVGSWICDTVDQNLMGRLRTTQKKE